MAGKPNSNSIARTFDSHWRLNESTGCHEWLGYKKRDGYGYLHDPSRGKVVGAHVFAYERAKGTSGGLHVCHECDNHLCVNAAHLFIGTNTDNRLDSVRKRRHAFGERHGRAKLTPECVGRIKDIWRLGGTSQPKIAAYFGVSQTQVSRIVREQRWAA